MGLTQPVRPGFRLIANDNDITATILERFERLTLTDESGFGSDVLEITLADNDPLNPIQQPPTGAELQLYLGYDGNAQRMGLFVCDEIELSGPPEEMVIRARAAVYDQTPKGKKDLQTQKTRSWPANTKLGDMVSKIAQEHGMQPAVSKSLASIQLPHIDQADESDINLLVRVGLKYYAVAKPAGGKLVLAKRGESKTISGQDLPSVTLDKSDCTRWRVVTSSRETAGMVVAYWHAVRNAKRHEVSVGSGEPVRRLKMYYPTQAMALAAARAELARRKRRQTTLALTAPGRTDLAAEAQLTLEGFRDGIAGEWLITRVMHSLDKGGAYRCDVEAERPNAANDNVPVDDVAD